MSLQQDFDNILIDALSNINDKFNVEDINLSDDFNVKIKLEGEYWDGYIDYKIASFVDKLQKDILQIHNRTFNENLSLRNKEKELQPVVVKVKIEQGCTEIIVHIKDIVMNMVDKMDSHHTLIALVAAMALAAGVYSYKSYLSHVEKIAETTGSTEDKRMFKEIAVAAIEQSKSSTTAINNLVSKMAKEDKITVGDNPVMTKNEAKESYTYDEHVPIEKTHYIDGKFPVTNINLKNQNIVIEIKKKPITASIKIMNEDAKHKLSEMVEKGLTLEYAPEVDLQISAVFIDGILKEAYCTDIGAKREDAVAYFDIIGKKPSRIQGPSQVSLLE